MRLLPLLLLLAPLGCSKNVPAPAIVEPSTISLIDSPGEFQPVGIAPSAAVPVAVEPKTSVSAGPVLDSGGTFAFPAGDAGKRLSVVLVSGAKLGEPDRDRRAAKPRTLPAYLNPESGTMVAPEFPIRRLSGVRSAPVRPMAIPDRVAVDFTRVDVVLPESPTFPVGPLTNNPGLDFNRPAPVQILGRYIPDRASLEDPTVDFIPAMVVNPALPLKEVVAPFVRLTLPDPFENAGPAQIKNPPKEDTNAALGTTAKPR